jgi:hypothetical protein
MRYAAGEYDMKKVIGMMVALMLVWGVASGAGISYIFNNTTNSMVVFADGSSHEALCTLAKEVRPDAVYIEVGTSTFVYKECK